jgi:hypothetical protein
LAGGAFRRAARGCTAREILLWGRWIIRAASNGRLIKAPIVVSTTTVGALNF